MKIHTAEIRCVRQIKELTLDLAAPLSVIAGPNGAGKTTVQQAILAAMFYPAKDMRDSFLSRFDPHSAPTVLLGLSDGKSEATIRLTRCLTDDKGEWEEGGTLLKRKKQALEKIQEVLPITAEAAALLLWGRQDDMTAVVENFPADGHSLLTAATIRGCGPDPKKTIKDLEKDIENARKGERGGQEVGALTQARKRLDALEKELTAATLADEQHRQRRGQLEQARKRREQVNGQVEQVKLQIEQQARLAKLLDSALQEAGILSELVKTQEDWAGLEEEIARAGKALAELERDLGQLDAMYRVARDQELGGQIETVQAKVRAVQDLTRDSTALDKELQARKRPNPADVKQLHTLQTRIKEANDKMQATGVRYELSVASAPRTVRIAEDGGPERELVLQPGQVHQGLAGRLVLDVDGVRLTSAGKEDISEHKSAVARNTQEMLVLFQKFAVDSEVAFLSLAGEKEELNSKLKDLMNALQLQLGSATLSALKTEAAALELARAENPASLKDRDDCAGKPLPSAKELDKRRARKGGEIDQARESLAALEGKRPNDVQRRLHQNNLEALRKKTRESAAAFTDADDLHRQPGRELLREIRKGLEERTRKAHDLEGDRIAAEKQLADLAGQLKQAQPHRSIDAIQADLEDAKETCNREEVLQQARALLKERIEDKIETLAGHVPVELGKKVTHHLASFTSNTYDHVVLSPELTVAHVGESRAHPEHWPPHQLSYGERHQAGLAVKIAVARALAETSGPVFIMLDDSLVTFDPQRRAATEEALLDLVADGKLQVILLTCHTDWAADWKQRCPEQVNHIDLTRATQYYRERTVCKTSA